MIKTVVTPESNTLHLSIPNDYIGKEIEVLLYSKDELVKETTTNRNNAARFKGLLTNEEASKYHAYLKQVRNEWSRDI
jgi:hypothetical protein